MRGTATKKGESCYVNRLIPSVEIDAGDKYPRTFKSSIQRLKGLARILENYNCELYTLCD